MRSARGSWRPGGALAVYIKVQEGLCALLKEGLRFYAAPATCLFVELQVDLQPCPAICLPLPLPVWSDSVHPVINASVCARRLLLAECGC